MKKDSIQGCVVLLLATVLQSGSLAAEPTSYTNPVGDSPIHMGDPFAFTHAGKYYLIGTTSPNEGFQCYESTDLANWQPKGWAWRKPATNSWAVGAFWAPEVKFYRGKFYLTYNGLVRDSKPNKLLMGLAVSDQPEGPYRDLHAPWFDPGYSTIDGHIFVDDDGTPYLYFSRNGSQDGYGYGINYGVQLERDLSKPVGEPVKLIEASQSWERINWAKNRCNEGATVLKHGGRYYMTYSANHTAFPGYGVGYATAPKPLGPWTKAEENPILADHLELGVSAPGHNSIVRTPDETEMFIVYHTHADPKNPSNDRVVNIDRLEFTADGKLRVIGPTRSPQPLPSAMSEPRVVEPQYDGTPVPPPKGAVIIFDGQDVSGWVRIPSAKDTNQSTQFSWKVDTGYMEVATPRGAHQATFVGTKESPITSGHLHIEWATPAEVKGDGQGRGNSGVFVGGFPELQVLDSFNNKTYFDGQAGAFYKQHPPLVNASRGPGLWQSYDIHIERAKVADGKVVHPATVTVYHNNVLVQDHVPFSNPVQAGDLRLQDHLNPVRFRNIWFSPTTSTANTKTP
jgi:GH43 family beta-xylosidase